jgi:hypothetical protein
VLRTPRSRSGPGRRRPVYCFLFSGGHRNSPGRPLTQRWAKSAQHPNLPADFDQNRSWSEPWGGTFGACRCGGSGWPPGGQASCEGLANTSCQDSEIAEWTVGRLQMAANGTLRRPAEPPSREGLRRGGGRQGAASAPNGGGDSLPPPPPFFIAAGFHKPHLPFYAPPHLFALYPEPVSNRLARAQLTAALNAPN